MEEPDDVGASAERTFRLSSVRIELIVRLTQADSWTVAELMRELGLTRNGIQRHLNELEQAKVVTWRTVKPPGRVRMVRRYSIEQEQLETLAWNLYEELTSVPRHRLGRAG